MLNEDPTAGQPIAHGLSDPTPDLPKASNKLTLSENEPRYASTERNAPTSETISTSQPLAYPVDTDTDLRTTDILEEEALRESGAVDLIKEHSQQFALTVHIARASGNAARFQVRILAAVTELVDYPRRIPFPDYKQLSRESRAMSTAFYIIFNTSSTHSITNLLLRNVPQHVQDVLGKTRPTFEDLMALPEPTTQDRNSWLVYFDGTIRWQMKDDPDDPFIRIKTDYFARRGKYVGSSVDYRGGGVRLDRHISAANTKNSGEMRQLHHQELCQEGTQANLRILATFDRDPRCKPYVPLLESIFMALIGTFVGRETPGRHNPGPCYELYDRMRDRASMPHIVGDGLNKALSIHQGMVGQAISRLMLFCMVCNRELQVGTSERDHSRLAEAGNPVGPRRCQTCHRHFTKYKDERESTSILQSTKREQKRKQHQLWVAAGNADVCGNTACAAPRVPGSSFTGFMTDARCANCASYLNYQAKKNITSNLKEERQPRSGELEERDHVWTGEEDAILQGIVNPVMGKTAWKKLARYHFPHMSAQLLKQRVALLRAESRKQNNKLEASPTRKPTPTRKTQSWTDSELNILKNGIRDGQTARTLHDLLPGRTLTAVNSKSSWLRKAGFL